MLGKVKPAKVLLSAQILVTKFCVYYENNHDNQIISQSSGA